MWDVAERKWLSTSLPVEAEILHTFVSPRGEILVLLRNPSIQLWNIATGIQLCALESEDIESDVAALSSDGAMLATGEEHGVIRLWDARTGRILHRIETHMDELRKLSFGTDATVLLAENGSLHVWDVASGRQLRTFASLDILEDWCLSPNGQMVATAMGSIIYLWDFNSGRQIQPANDRDLLVTALRFSHDGHRLVIKGEDGSCASATGGPGASATAGALPRPDGADAP